MLLSGLVGAAPQVFDLHLSEGLPSRRPICRSFRVRHGAAPAAANAGCCDQRARVLPTIRGRTRASSCNRPFGFSSRLPAPFIRHAPVGLFQRRGNRVQGSRASLVAATGPRQQRAARREWTSPPPHWVIPSGSRRRRRRGRFPVLDDRRGQAPQSRRQALGPRRRDETICGMEDGLRLGSRPCAPAARLLGFPTSRR
jgi:hypothetical protein